MNKFAYSVLAWLAVSSITPTAWAVQLDTSFGEAGYVRTNITSYNGYHERSPSVLVQTDGKIVVVGVSDNDLALIRYNVDGTRDTGFGVNGQVTNSAVEIVANSIGGLVEQSDGKIVVAAFSIDIWLFRFNSDGTIDESFGTDGLVTTDVGGTDTALSIIRQSDGKLVVSGTTSTHMSLTRYAQDGVLDTDFGVDGTASLGIGNTQAYAVVQQSDGKLVAAGGDYIARFNTNGTLDSNFDTDGWNTVPAAVGSAADLAFQSNGQFVILGSSAGDMVVTRFNADGSLDTDFGTAGVTITDAGGTEFGRGIVSRITDSRIVVAGMSHSGVDARVVVLRYDANGILDTSFATDGIAELDLGDYADYAESIVQQSDDKYVLAGQTFDGVGTDFVTMRYNYNGTLDTGFDSNGYRVDWIGQKTKDVAVALVAQSDGKLAAGGWAVYSADQSDLNAPADMALTRYQTNGDLDSGFADGGRFVHSLVSPHTGTKHLIRQTDDKLVSLVETYDGSSLAGALLRHDVDGSIDTSFGSSGVSSLTSYPITGIQQLDGKLVVYLANSELQRFDALGDPDLGFGTAGVVLPSVDGPAKGRYSIVQQSGGKLVFAGILGLERYTESGVVDATFGVGGQVIFSDSIYPPMVDQQTDGKLIVAYFPNDGEPSTSDPTLTIKRYSANGVLDTSFGNAGTTTTVVDNNTGSKYIHALQLQEDGKLVVFVRIDAFRFKLVRYNTNGSLDTSFDDDGVFDLPFSVGNTLGTTADGDMVYASGEFFVLVADQNDFFMAKIIDPVSPPVGSAPVAGPFTAIDVTQTNAGESSYRISISYSDADGDLDISSIGLTDVKVCNNGTCTVVTGAPSISSGTSSASVSYWMTPPGGTWDAADNGTYTIAINANEIADEQLNHVAADANAGSFTVSITPPTPVATVITAAIPANTGALIEFTADFSDASIIDFTAICNGGWDASGSGSPLLVTGLTNGETYQCLVVTNRSDGSSPASNIVSVTPSDGGEGTLPPSGDGSGEPVTFTHTATPPGDGGSIFTYAFEGTFSGDSVLFNTGDRFIGSYSFDPRAPIQQLPDHGSFDLQSTKAISEWHVVVQSSVVDDFTVSGSSGAISVGDNKAFGDHYVVTLLADGGLPLGLNLSYFNINMQDFVASGADMLSGSGLSVFPNLSLAEVAGGRFVIASPPMECSQCYFTLDVLTRPTPVAATLTVNATETSPPEPPPEADSLVAAIDISSTSAVTGYTLTVDFTIDASSRNEFTGFWKYGKESSEDDPHWYDYGTLAANGDGTGYELSEDKKTLTVYLVDGMRGDDDLLANGSIVDPALPLVQVSPLIFRNSFE